MYIYKYIYIYIYINIYVCIYIYICSPTPEPRHAEQTIVLPALCLSVTQLMSARSSASLFKQRIDMLATRKHHPKTIFSNCFFRKILK